MDQLNYVMFQMPEKSKWECHLTTNLVIIPDKGKEPCWFHRKMQELCFGFRWVKTK